MDCKLGSQYYQFLEEDLEKNKNNSWTTIKRLINIHLIKRIFNFLIILDRVMSTISCKSDCNFNRLFSVPNTQFSNQTSNVSQSIISLLPANIIVQCKNSIGKYLPQMNSVSDVLGNTSIIRFDVLKQIELIMFIF